MRLSLSIPFVTGVVLLCTVAVNIVWLGVFIGELFPRYLNSIFAEKQVSPTTPDPVLLKAFIQAKNLDAETITEYETVISDLQRFTDNLTDISKNPENYIGDSNTGNIHPSFTSNAILAGMRLIAQVFAGIGREGWAMSLEEIFIRDILIRIIVLNLIWIALVFISYFLWIKNLFRPITIVTENLKNIIEKRKFTSIGYDKKDEFTPLTEMINDLNKSLVLQEKIRSDFLSDLSHEIRTPLTSVRLYLEWLHDGVITSSPETLKHLDTEMNRLSEITEKIMMFERLAENEWETIHVEHFFPQKIALELAKEYIPQLVKSDQTIEVRIPDNTEITMDQGMYIQILHNIFSNFIKYAWLHTMLTLTLRLEKKYFVLECFDTGKWVPENEIPFLLEKFYRVDKSRTRDEGSMGIWLSIIDRIARLHGGNCTVSNKEGTGFSVTIRIAR